MLNLKLQVKVIFKTLYTNFSLNTTTNMACFTQNVCIFFQQTCNLRTGNGSVRPCIKWYLSLIISNWILSNQPLAAKHMSNFYRFVLKKLCKTLKKINLANVKDFLPSNNKDCQPLIISQNKTIKTKLYSVNSFFYEIPL